jgi:hypothetical protein
MVEITGSTNISQKKIQVYSAYPLDAKSYKWIVKGGLILYGQGTRVILIHWTSIHGGTIELDIVTCDDNFEAMVISVEVQGSKKPSRNIIKKLLST